MLKSNYEKIVELNKLAGNFTYGGWLAAEAQLKLIESEFNELKKGIEEKNVKEVRDGIADVLVTVYGLAYRLGIDADLDFAAVHESNMSKFDLTEEDQKLTRVKYLKLGVDTKCIISLITDTTYYVTKSLRDQTGTDGKDYPAGKFLKSIHFKEPVFEDLSKGARATLDLDYIIVNELSRREYVIGDNCMYGSTARNEAFVPNATIWFRRRGEEADLLQINVHLKTVEKISTKNSAVLVASLFYGMSSVDENDPGLRIEKIRLDGFDYHLSSTDFYPFQIKKITPVVP